MTAEATTTSDLTPEQHDALFRSAVLAQRAGVHPTVTEWFGLPGEYQAAWVRAGDALRAEGILAAVNAARDPAAAQALLGEAPGGKKLSKKAALNLAAAQALAETRQGWVG